MEKSAERERLTKALRLFALLDSELDAKMLRNDVLLERLPEYGLVIL